MSVIATKWAWRQWTGLSTRNVVLLALADFADENGRCWPSVRSLCRMTKLCERTIRSCLSELEAAGLITRARRVREDGGHSSNEYLLRLDAGVGAAVDAPPLTDIMDAPPLTDVRVHPIEPLPRTKKAPNGAFIEDLKERSSHPKRPVWGSFEEFWMAYPAKVGKEAARRKFSTVGKSGRVKFTDLMTALETYKARKPHDRPWCYPTTWLNQGRWEDEHGAISDERRRNYASV